MTELERLTATDAIRQLKARYFRGVDTGKGEEVRELFTEDCELDYTGCFIDPASGRDFLSAYSMVVRGRASFPTATLADAGIVSVHQGHTMEIDITGETTATGVWSMTDRLYLPAGAPFALVTGYGHYHETYQKVGGDWKIRTLRLTRIRIEAS